MPIVTLTNFSLAFGEDQIFDAIDLSIEKGERIAFTGRNGAGKSTLLKVISGEESGDDGAIWRDGSLKFVTLSQDLPERRAISVYEAVVAVFDEMGDQLAEFHALAEQMASDDAVSKRMDQLQSALDHAGGWNISHRVEATLDRLHLDPDARLDSLSGGWLKRVAIAQSLVQEPDVWILDEPTNHLDVDAIEWLEEVLLEFGGTLLFVSHDRQLMQSVATSIVEIDRGRVTRYDCDYESFIERRDKNREVEQEQNKQFDDKLKKEEAWIRQGIKARRTRNEGRVRALKALREERRKRVSVGEMKLQVDSGISSGKIVKEASGLSKSMNGEMIIRDLDLIIQRGDRVGILGPNGCGKSTLLKLLLEELMPDGGALKTGTKLQVAYFDQAREQLDPDRSVYDYIAEGRDFIEVNGKERHVVSYLQDFLFSPDRSRSHIRKLSGGEQNRLLLAKLFTMPANLLVLDEPTNDLDIETLELLENLLIEYHGTVLLVSHDRAFMDNVVSSLLVFEGDGVVTEYVGGYSDWALSQEGTPASLSQNVSESQRSEGKESHEARKKQKAAEQKRLRDVEKITTQIDEIEKALSELNEEMADSAFFESSAENQSLMYERAAEYDERLRLLMSEWEQLEAGE